MTTEVKPIPEGMHTVTPSLTIKGAVEAIEFYKKALGAEALMCMPAPDGRVAHAELRIGTSTLFINDEFTEMGGKSAATLGGSPVSFVLYVEDADAAFERAVQAGAEIVMPVADQFWGDRWGVVADPYGCKWSFATHVKDLTPEEMDKASKEFWSQAGSASA